MAMPASGGNEKHHFLHNPHSSLPIPPLTIWLWILCLCAQSTETLCLWWFSSANDIINGVVWAVLFECGRGVCRPHGSFLLLILSPMYLFQRVWYHVQNSLHYNISTPILSTFLTYFILSYFLPFSSSSPFFTSPALFLYFLLITVFLSPLSPSLLSPHHFYFYLHFSFSFISLPPHPPIPFSFPSFIPLSTLSLSYPFLPILYSHLSPFSPFPSLPLSHFHSHLHSLSSSSHSCLPLVSHSTFSLFYPFLPLDYIIQSCYRMEYWFLSALTQSH